jgi:hypothetical protein
MRRLIPAVIGGLLLVDPVYAAPAQQSGLHIQGPGTEPCAFVAALYRDNPKQAKTLLFGWAQGFLAGANIAGSLPVADVGAMTVENQEAYLRRYCETHPQSHYVEGVMALYTALPKKPRQN